MSDDKESLKVDDRIIGLISYGIAVYLAEKYVKPLIKRNNTRDIKWNG